MQKSPAFRFYPADFLVGTMSMSTEEIGAYILLLCHQWDQGHIPADPEKCARLARCSTDAIASVLHKFCICNDGTAKNKRLELEREKQDERRVALSANSKKRWKGSKKDADAMQLHTKSNADAMQLHTKSNADAMQLESLSFSCTSSIVPLSSPEGDNESVTSLTEAAEKKEGGRVPAARIAAEAAARILAMFPDATQLSAVCQGQLHEAVENGTLPADEKKWRALEAMRAERAEIIGVPDDYDLRAGWLISKEAMCRKLGEALDTALAKRPQAAAIAPQPKKAPAPPFWQNKLITLYPNAHVPDDFYELPPDIRAEVKGVQP